MPAACVHRCVHGHLKSAYLQAASIPAGGIHTPTSAVRSSRGPSGPRLVDFIGLLLEAVRADPRRRTLEEGRADPVPALGEAFELEPSAADIQPSAPRALPQQALAAPRARNGTSELTAPLRRRAQGGRAFLRFQHPPGEILVKRHQTTDDATSAPSTLRAARPPPLARSVRASGGAGERGRSRLLGGLRKRSRAPGAREAAADRGRSGAPGGRDRDPRARLRLVERPTGLRPARARPRHDPRPQRLLRDSADAR